MQENNLKALTNNGKNVKIEVDSGSESGCAELSVNLDNANNSALPFVQMSRELITSNGCHVKLIFREESKPGVREEIARLLLASFEEKESVS